MKYKFIMAACAAALVFNAVTTAQTPPKPAAPAMEPYYAQSWADYLAMKAKAKPPQLPDWSGIWQRPFRDFGNTASYIPPLSQLTPKYLAAYKATKAKVAQGIEWDRLSYCLPVGMPRWLTEPWQREFIVTPGVTWLIHEQISEVRRIYTDGKSHTSPGEVPPLWQGESIGFWDGDTLVVHTTHLKAGEYQRSEPNFSFHTSIVERIRKTNDDTIEDEATVYDPESLLKPFVMHFSYKKSKNPNQRINFGSCEEGNNAVRTPEGSTTFVLPGEPEYRDPATFGIPEVALDSLPSY